MDRGTCCDQVQFRGSLLELTELARCARAGLGGNLAQTSLILFDPFLILLSVPKLLNSNENLL